MDDQLRAEIKAQLKMLSRLLYSAMNGEADHLVAEQSCKVIADMIVERLA